MRFVLFLFVIIVRLGAQDPAVIDPPSDDRFWLSGQANFIEQFHPSFRARYSGANSLNPTAENALSRILTLYSGVQITHSLEFLVDVESAGGRGVSDALGLGGFTNLDVVRNPSLGQSPYIARIMLHKVFALGKAKAPATRGPLNLASELPVRRLEIHAGKLSTADFFDLNSLGSDSHLQFMNWSADNNGAYDYAADTRGYTYGAVIEYFDKSYVLRFGEMLMPKVANGIHLDANLSRARGENFEAELHLNSIPNRPGILRPLFYLNHANMGNYQEAIHAYRARMTSAPDVTASRRQGRLKYGFGLNAEQEITESLRAYGRLGWSEGRQESFAYTEVDRTAAFGADLRGTRWKRSKDKVGATLIFNALSGDHREYLALGGQGFLLGDGALNYRLEKTVEIYYNLHLFRGISFSADLQRVWNPGYNRDRGPVLVPAFRMHFEDAISFRRHASAIPKR